MAIRRRGQVRDGIMDGTAALRSTVPLWRELAKSDIPPLIWQRLLKPILEAEVRTAAYLREITPLAEAEATEPKVTRRPGRAPVATGRRAAAVAR